MLIGFSLSGMNAGYERIDIPCIPQQFERFRISELQVKLDSSRLYLADAANSDVFRIKQFDQSGERCTWLGVYRSTRERGGYRDGGYLSAGLWVNASVLDGRRFLDVLRYLAEDLTNRFVSRGEFSGSVVDARRELRQKYEQLALTISEDLTAAPDFPLHRENLMRLYDVSNVSPEDEAFVPSYLQFHGALTETEDVLFTYSREIIERNINRKLKIWTLYDAVRFDASILKGCRITNSSVEDGSDQSFPQVDASSDRYAHETSPEDLDMASTAYLQELGLLKDQITSVSQRAVRVERQQQQKEAFERIKIYMVMAIVAIFVSVSFLGAFYYALKFGIIQI